MSGQRKNIALLIPAHNESLVLADTINSAIAANLSPEHIYVVDDNSSDGTARIARSILPRENVCRVRRSGKGLAIQKAAKKFALTQKYRWIHVADADGQFAPDYFRVLRRDLRVKNAAATGYIRSLQGSFVGQYRVFEYTLGMEIHRRVQAPLGVIPIIPGPTSCFRWDVFDQLNFSAETLTEDFDVTMQIYRQKLGKIQFIPAAKAFTQDPLNLKDFITQVTRWNRGILQVMNLHKSFRRISTIDIYLKYQLAQNLLFFVNFFVWIPYMAFFRFGPAALAVAFLYDVGITLILTLFAAVKAKRYDILGAFPFIYLLRWISLLVFLKSFIEVIILRRFLVARGVWDTGSRRYKLSKAN